MTCPEPEDHWWVEWPDGSMDVAEYLGGDGAWEVTGCHRLLNVGEVKPLERIPTVSQLKALRTVLETEPSPRVLVEDVCEVLDWEVPEPMAWRE